MTEIFRQSNYRSILKSQVSGEKKSWGGMTRLAKAAGCQRPYLSRVLAGDAQLTPAQAYGLARFWKFSPEETEYFLGLLEIERAGSAEYREFWARKVARAKKEHENLANLVERKAAANDERNLYYYSNWQWTAIHILVSIPEFQTDKAIADRLSLPLFQVKSILEALEKWGAVRRESGRWKYGSWEQHIPKESPLSVFHHANWRQRAVMDAQSFNQESVHFTVVQSLSKVDYEKLKEMVLDFIQKAAKIAGPSKEEKLMCLACDFFEP